MERIKDLNIEALKWLCKIPKNTWARYAFNIEVKCDHVTNNFTESFNAWVGEFRGKPIMTLAEGIRSKMMSKLHKRYQKGCTWNSTLSPKYIKKLKLIGDESRRCNLMVASENNFEVHDIDKTYIVNLLDRTCECGTFKFLVCLANMLHLEFFTEGTSLRTTVMGHSKVKHT
ncbi:hypothetical protein ACH5RR_016918 [Cinchona calisaya]|uniref:Uncharacterized protein n=1 Tax=Cinchona calisaya TaxID=153742 RepID=A0ABD2ZXC1_9GENT